MGGGDYEKPLIAFNDFIWILSQFRGELQAVSYDFIFTIKIQVNEEV